MDVRSAGLARRRQLGVIHIDADDGCAAKGRPGYGAKSNAATTYDGDRITGATRPRRSGVEADRERLDEAQLLEVEIGAI